MHPWVAPVAAMAICLGSLLLMATLGWISRTQKARLSALYLAGVVALLTLQALEFYYHAAELYLAWPVFLKMADPLVVLLPFFLYGYARALQGVDVLQPRRRVWLHALPMIGVALLDIPYWALPAADKIEWMHRGIVDESAWHLLTPYGNGYLAIIAVCCAVYGWAQWRRPLPVRDAQTRAWVQRILWLQWVGFFSLGLRILFSEATGNYVSLVFVLAPVVFYLTYAFLLEAKLPKPGSQPRESAVLGAAEDMAEPGTAPKAEEATEQLLFQELKAELERGAYRDNELSLGKLAAACGMSSHMASLAINTCSGGNFYDWINTYRVQEAMQRLRETDEAITSISFAVGFNSKSTFNTAFRRIAGCTPSEYRKGSQKL